MNKGPMVTQIKSKEEAFFDCFSGEHTPFADVSLLLERELLTTEELVEDITSRLRVFCGTGDPKENGQ